MQLSPKNAQEIVNEISQIVQQNVNMMDENGTIIASTDQNRIGTFHPGAKEIIDQRLAEMYIDETMESALMRKGLNLPIVFEGQVVGVIGITGEYEQVIKYGQIVKKMTEILLMDADSENKKRITQRVRDRYLDEWVRGSGSKRDRSFVERGMMLGIDITRPRRIMAVSLDSTCPDAPPGELQQQIEAVEMRIRQYILQNPNNQIFRTTNKMILIVDRKGNEEMRSLAREICALVPEKYPICLTIGIDSAGDANAIMHQAYDKAMKAWKVSLGRKGQIVLYDEINMEIFIEEIPNPLKEEYLHKIFKGYTLEELCREIRMLEAYFACEGSIMQASEKLFIHKNTLQYKLKKLHERTGFDVRQPSSTALFYIAILFYKDVESELLEYW